MSTAKCPPFCSGLHVSDISLWKVMNYWWDTYIYCSWFSFSNRDSNVQNIIAISATIFRPHTSWHGTPFHNTDHLWGKLPVSTGFHSQRHSNIIKLCYFSRCFILHKRSSCVSFWTPWRSRAINVMSIRPLWPASYGYTCLYATVTCRPFSVFVTCHWLNAKMTSLQCVSKGVTSLLF